jgi:hypothetical protein
MFGRKTKFQSERLMADVYLGIMIAGVNTLIVLGAALAFVVVWKAALVGGLGTKPYIGLMKWLKRSQQSSVWLALASL